MKFMKTCYNDDKEAVMKYLKSCGVDDKASSAVEKIHLEDVDESSMALLIQLSQGKVVDMDVEVDVDVDIDTEPVLIVEEKGKGQDEGNNKKTASNDIVLKEDEKKANIHSANNVNDVTINNEKSMKSQSNPNGGLILPTKQTKFENRDFEQLLAQFSLDSKSFDRTRTRASRRKTLKKNKSEPKLFIDTHDDFDDDHNEEWQGMNILSDKLERNNEQIAACSDQIQSLSRLVAQDMVERRQIWDAMQQQQQNYQQYNNNNPQMTFQNPSHAPNNSPPFAMPRNSTTIQHDEQEQQQRPQNDEVLPPAQSFIFTLLETFFTYLFLLPRKIINYIQSTRIYRLIHLIHTEAKAFQQNGHLRNNLFIDFSLIFKIMLFSFFMFLRFDDYDEGIKRKLGINSSNSKRASKELALLQAWQSQRLHLLVLSSVIVYFVRTGIWKFLYHIVIKNNVVRRVWRNEDLDDNRDGDMGTGNHNGDGNDGQRRGRRDREPLNDGNMGGGQGRAGDGNDAANNGGNNRDNDNNGPGQVRVFRNVMEYIQGQTFLGGIVDRPIVRNQNEQQPPHLQVPREQILIEKVIDSAKDVLYLFGTFFLSLFPMWHLRPREVPVVADNNGDEQRQDEQNENMDGGEEEEEAEENH